MTASEPSTPSEALAQGKCPACLGKGTVERVVPVPGAYDCSVCGGSGDWPVPRPPWETLG